MQFLDGTTALGTVTISGRSASLAVSKLAVGAHSITAVYSGDTNTAASTSAVLTQTVMGTVADVQRIINEALGGAPVESDLNSDGTINVVDIEIVINAVLGM
jgi:hypothetical protein